MSNRSFGGCDSWELGASATRSKNVLFRNNFRAFPKNRFMVYRLGYTMEKAEFVYV